MNFQTNGYPWHAVNIPIRKNLNLGNEFSLEGHFTHVLYNIKTTDGREGRDIDELLFTIQHELKSETRAVDVLKKYNPINDNKEELNS
jgi:hypothetical protein